MIHHDITDYLEALFNIHRGEQRKLASELGLQQIHLQILYYLERCNRYSDSLLVLTEFLGQTKGTVSTSVALLVKKGYLIKQPDPVDKRKSHLQLTETGVQAAARQTGLWQAGQGLLDDAQNEQVRQALDVLLRQLQQANDYKVFGACHSCRHLCTNNGGHYCGLTNEALNSAELQQICVYHQES
ncbi:MarR family winged helix-turn-helix transcriptional regulator [Aliamphritea spongicola]|uniref:MarR family winged helix-turn-helix transcriptional regulator n=1 Tax=Aliamphritea spongicola TaxID=707589 RepID=UPI00196B2449|nr:MarR family winged helix-turn-helix transcriptional regulator [Aliamphritea spongicola]MBN3561880.1 winged helix-turn-helix transcriptional regulator [Aliamphritea spongicola]